MNKHIVLVGFAALLCACATPEPPRELVEARETVPATIDQRYAREAAAESVAMARKSLNTANELQEQGKPATVVRHHAYLAESYAEIVAAEIRDYRNEREIAKADERRTEILLRSREREAERARRDAEMARAEASMARADAERARKAAVKRAQEARDLAAELEDLKSAEDERGTVFTLDSVLFDTDEAALKPGAQPTLSRLAQFLQQREGEIITILGHTDSRGSAEYNEELSRRRAQAVRNALVDLGLNADKIRAEGRGEAYPVATNETSAGRQQNRRVEIIVGGADENLGMQSAAN